MDGVPLYKEIYEDLRGRIQKGEYSENSVLPAERVLCQVYHVSRSTIRAALEELHRNGYIIKAHGNGNFVKPKVFEQRLTKFHSFAGSLKAQHILIKNQILDYELIENDKYLDSLTNIRHMFPRSCRWHKLTRLRSAETFPLMIETSYLLQSRFIALEPAHIPCMLCERFCHEREQLIVIHRTVVRGDKFKFKAAYYIDEKTE